MAIRRRESTFDIWVDFASVILISAATVMTAWCGYQAARWTALQTREYNEASAHESPLRWLRAVPIPSKSSM